MPGFQKAQDISDAQALEQFEVGPLDLYAAQLANWSSSEGTPWAAEQAAFAAADAGLATSASDANVANVTAIDGANIIWTQSMDSAIADRANEDAAAAVTAEEGIADAQLTEAQSLADAELAHAQGLDAANASEQIADAGAAGTAADNIESAQGALANSLAKDGEVGALAVSDINLAQANGSMTPDAAAAAIQNAENAKTTSDAAANSTYTGAFHGAEQTLTVAVDTQMDPEFLFRHAMLLHEDGRLRDSGGTPGAKVIAVRRESAATSRVLRAAGPVAASSHSSCRNEWCCFAPSGSIASTCPRSSRRWSR